MNFNPIFYIQIFSEFVGSLVGENLFGEFTTSFVEIITLFISISVLVGFIKHALHKETYDKTLGKTGLAGSVSGAILGILTPVCSCSVTGLYAGLVANGASRQGSAAFLFAAPAVNEFAIALMFQVAGWQGALIYLIIGFVSATATGYFSKYLGIVPLPGRLTGHNHEHQFNLLTAFMAGVVDTLKSLRVLLLPIMMGVGIGKLISNYLPNLLETIKIVGSSWYGPIVASAVGLPLHIEAASAASVLLPIVKTSLPLGTAVSLLMSVTISSVPEVIVLRKIIGNRGVVKLSIWYFVYCSLIGLVLNFLLR